MNKDNINPEHYKQGIVECIVALEAATTNKSGIEAVCTASAIKYLWRYEAKNGLEDVKKAQWYINRLIEHLEIKDRKYPLTTQECFKVKDFVHDEKRNLRVGDTIKEIDGTIPFVINYMDNSKAQFYKKNYEGYPEFKDIPISILQKNYVLWDSN